MGQIDFAKLTPIEAMVGEDDEETIQLRLLYHKAEEFIGTFKWLGKIEKVYFGLGVADLIGVFLFEITPKSDEVDRFLWVVVGDVPPAYLVSDDAPNSARALVVYIEEMKRWADAVEAGTSIEDCIPVDGAPTQANAALLKKRLEFIDEEILRYCKDDLS